jgi:peptidoglycan/xylan/chitin deacetylase (PgdA/CDA1 family)
LSKVIFYTVLLIVLLSCEKSQKLEEIDVNNIKLSAWYDGKQCAFTFTFDDNTPKHKEIGDLLSRYNLKGSFFVNPGFSNFQEYKELYKKLIEDGHEIGNHTFGHKNLVSSDSSEIEKQVSKGAIAINNELGIFPLSFVHPYNAAIDSVNKIVYKYHLFSRIISPYNLVKRKIYDVNPNWPEINEVKDVITLWKDYWVIIAGHGYGDNDVSWDFLENLCKEVKGRDDVWVERLSVIAAYDYIREETFVYKVVTDDIIFIKIENFDSLKYSKLEQLPTSLKVPVLSDDIILKANLPQVNVRYQDSTYYFNFDLKEITQFEILKSKKN